MASKSPEQMTSAERYAARMSMDQIKFCVTPGCEQERQRRRDGLAYVSIHCEDHHYGYSLDPNLKCNFGCGATRVRDIRGSYSNSYCSLHNSMRRTLGTFEAKEWYRHGKLLVPSGSRRDARTGDGFLYVINWPSTGLVVCGIAASRDLVESRTRTHERMLGGLELIEVRSCLRGGAFKLESIIKLRLRQSDHFPYVPAGSHKWTEIFAYHDFMDLYLKLTEPGCLLD